MHFLCLHQLRLRDYTLDNQSKAPIGPDDILNIVPVVKHIHTPTADASKAYHAAQNFIQKGWSIAPSLWALCDPFAQWPFELSEYNLPLCFPTAGLLDQAHERLKEAAYLFGRVCDDLQPQACYCHSLLAKVAYLQGKTAEVQLLLQHNL